MSQSVLGSSGCCEGFVYCFLFITRGTYIEKKLKAPVGIAVL